MSEKPPPVPQSAKPVSGREQYNIVTDTIVGVNVRGKDNLFQALAIVVCLILGAGIGYFTTRDGAFGAMIGAFAGLLVGLFGSGIFLMIYRAIRHARGKHE